MKAILLVLSTFFLAFWLSILTMPDWSLWARPDWVLLVLIYWALAFPERFGVWMAALAGLLQDNLLGSFLGKHMIVYALIVAVIIVMHQRFRMYELWHQARIIFFLVLSAHVLILFVDWLMGYPSPLYLALPPALLSALIWPWLMVALRGLRRYFGLMAKIHS